MFGTDMIPFASGYTIGYNIVKLFKQKMPYNKDIEVKKLYNR